MIPFGVICSWPHLPLLQKTALSEKKYFWIKEDTCIAACVGRERRAIPGRLPPSQECSSWCPVRNIKAEASYNHSLQDNRLLLKGTTKRVGTHPTLTANAALPVQSCTLSETHTTFMNPLSVPVKHDECWPTSMLLPVCMQSRTSFESIPASFGFPQLHLDSNTHTNTFNEDICWKSYFQHWFGSFLPATIGDFRSSRSWIAVLAKTTLLFSDAVWTIKKTSHFSSSRWRNLAVKP